MNTTADELYTAYEHSKKRDPLLTVERFLSPKHAGSAN